MGAPTASQRSKRIAPFEVMDIVAAARIHEENAASVGGEAVLHLEVGQPSARPPDAVLEAAREALDGPLGYTDALGTAELREGISDLYTRRTDARVSPDRVAVTSGASAGCVLAFLALCDPGDRVLVFEPGYPCYRNIAEALGLEVESVTLDAESSYVPTPAHCESAAAHGTPLAAVVVASPANPTGAALSDSELNALHAWCAANGATLVVDEIYHGTATTALPTAARFEDVVVVQSFSKYFCMTGWRLGWLVVPAQLLRPIEALQQNLYLAPNTLSQAAALAALKATSALDEHSVTYSENRETLIAALEHGGVTDFAPARGAFYVWADLSDWGPSRELCRTWLADLGVAATPGSDFDRSRGDSFVRFSVAGSADDVREASARLQSWLKTHPCGVEI